MAASLAAGCSGGDGRDSRTVAKDSVPSGMAEPTPGIPPALPPGPGIPPVELPRGFTIFPGAQVTANTIGGKSGQRPMLIVLETREPVATVVGFYREQARGAGVALAFDLGSEDRASLGGVARDGSRIVLAAVRTGGITRAELSVD